MAKDEQKSTAPDKGKGKAVDTKPTNGASEKDAAKNGKKDEKDTQTEDLNEEDQKLKDELDMLVERLTESDHSLYKPASTTPKKSLLTNLSLGSENKKKITNKVNDSQFQYILITIKICILKTVFNITPMHF